MRYGSFRGGDGGADVAFGMMQGVSMFGDAIAQGQKNEANALALEDERGVRAAYEQIAQRVGNQGDISALDADPLMNTRHGTMAAGKFFKDRAMSETSRLQMLKGMEAADDQFYQSTFRPLAFAAQEAFKTGDMQRFGNVLGELSVKSPMPYQLRYNEADGSFDEMFRSTKDSGFVNTGRKVSPKQAFDELNEIMSGEQKVLSGMNMQTRVINPRFLSASSRYKMGTILGNADAMSDPKQWIPMEKDGRTVWAVPQSRHDDYSAAPAYRIVDDGGKMGGFVESLDVLAQQGWARADVKARLNKMRGGRGAADGSGFQLTQGDRNLLLKFATTEDEMGNKVIDAGKAAFLEGFIQRTGLSPLNAVAAFEGNVKESMSKGANRTQAEKAAMIELTRAVEQRKGGAVKNGAQQGGAAAIPPQDQGQASGSRVKPQLAQNIIAAAQGGGPGYVRGIGFTENDQMQSGGGYDQGMAGQSSEDEHLGSLARRNINRQPESAAIDAQFANEMEDFRGGRARDARSRPSNGPDTMTRDYYDQRRKKEQEEAATQRMPHEWYYQR